MEALKLYEARNYKKSLKLLDTTLKKNSGHVDSLILKALNLQFSSSVAEAATYVQKAVNKIDGIKVSPIGCHLLGIYYRQTKQYADAVKWFKASLENGSTNTHIYRDLASLQSQIHDFKGVLESRKMYWENYMGYRANWTSLAIAYDLNGQPSEAINILSRFEELAAGKLGDAEMFENSECLMYKNDLMYKKAGNDPTRLKETLENLEKIEKDVLDKYGWLERKAAILMKLELKREASLVYRALIKRNPDGFKYYRLLEVSLGIQSNNQLKAALYQKLAKFYPKSEPPKFIPLTFIQDMGELKTKLGDYILGQLKRGVPAAFNNIKPLYRKSSVSSVVEDVALEYYQTISPRDQPIQYIWTTYFLALHYLHLKKFHLANEFADKALNHTPTLVELYILKARVLKHLGLLEDAAATMNKGRELDLQDRFINAKTVKYMLRANMIDEAVKVVSLFTKNDSSVNGVLDLHTLEASWFIVEQGDSYYRLCLDSSYYVSCLDSVEKLQLKYKDMTSASEEDKLVLEKQLKDADYNCKKYQGLSLKRYLAVAKIYKQFDDDQLDFHSYCMRKGTPRHYLKMLEWGTNLFTSPMFLRAMEGAAKIFFMIDDSLKRANEEIEGDDVSTKKKNNKKAKKEAAALNKQREEEKSHVLAQAGDDDPFGEDLLKDTDPLGAFNRAFFAPYLSHAKDSNRRYILEFEYHIRTGKLALAYGALNKYIKHYGKNSVAGALGLILLEHTTDAYAHEEIAKKVALKGIEKDLPELLTESDDKLKVLDENFNLDIKGLLLLHQNLLNSVSIERVKTLIMDALGDEEPSFQNQVLQYEFR